MPTRQDVRNKIDIIYKEIQFLETSLERLEKSARDDFQIITFQKRRNHEINLLYRQIDKLLAALEIQPERHFTRHNAEINQFEKDGVFDKNVFIMTKFVREGDISKEAQRLSNVIEAIKRNITLCGYKPRIANQQQHHRWLWDNVELYLYGCKRGIALVEDRYQQELNPNLAMEWGWMVGMGRDVLFLREKGFSHDRADWSGLISSTFDWNNPNAGISKAIESFLL